MTRTRRTRRPPRAGFHITPHPIDPSSYDVMIGDVTNRCDLMRSSWTAAYPDARSTLDPLLNGEHIVLTGNHNYSLFNDPMKNRKIDDLNTWTDLGQVANLYPNLDQEIMTNHAPVIPTYDRPGTGLFEECSGGRNPSGFPEFSEVGRETCRCSCDCANPSRRSISAQRLASTQAGSPHRREPSRS